MKFLFCFLALTLLASAHRLEHRKQDFYNQGEWDSKHFLKQHDRYQTFDQGKSAFSTPQKHHDIGKVKKFDVDFHRFDETTLDHSKPVEEFKVKPFAAPSTRLRMVEPERQFIEKDQFEHRPEREDFNLEMHGDDLKMKKPHFRSSVKIPTDRHGREHHMKHRDFEPGYTHLEDHTGHLVRGDKLLDNGLKKIDRRNLNKPIFGVRDQFFELEGNMGYLRKKERSLADTDYFHGSNNQFEHESDKLMQGSDMMEDGFKYMEVERMGPRFETLNGEFHRLGDRTEQLNESDEYMKDVDFDDEFAHLEKEKNGILSGKGIMDSQFTHLQNNDLNTKYDDLTSKVDSSMKMTDYNDHMTGADFTNGFGVLKNHFGKVKGGDSFMGDTGSMMMFPGFGK